MPTVGTQLEKETEYTGADSMEFQNSNMAKSTEPDKDTEQILRDPETEEDRSEQQIREIDKDLGFNEIPIIMEPAIEPSKDKAIQAMQAMTDMRKRD